MHPGMMSMDTHGQRGQVTGNKLEDRDLASTMILSSMYTNSIGHRDDWERICCVHDGETESLLSCGVPTCCDVYIIAVM